MAHLELIGGRLVQRAGTLTRHLTASEPGILARHLASRQILARKLTTNPRSLNSSPSPLPSPAASSEEESPDASFKKARMGDFRQEAPRHEHAWKSDSLLRSYIGRTLPREVLTGSGVEGDLERWGERVVTEVWNLGQECGAREPYLEQTDAWGHRVDRVVTCEAWKKQKAIAAEEGLVSIPYTGTNGPHDRLYQVAKLLMYAPASGMYSCPLAMTDGAAATIKALGLESDMEEAWDGLTSRDPKAFWTSGQWMTEPRGGSDVGAATDTIATPAEDGGFRLHGYKWFSSATDSDMALTLARVNNSPRLSMFYLKTRDSTGALNGIQVAKMKNKLGTRQLPTAELLLSGTEARLVGAEGRGIATIANMLTISRLHNIIMAVGSMRKVVSLARDFATRRKAFGRPIAGQPLHLQTLARMEVETRGCQLLLLELARQQGLAESNLANDQDTLLLRLFTPVAKFYTAKASVATISEGLECFGGQGYIEDTGLPGLLRDAQVLPIWEGTSSVMALDVRRAIAKTNGAALAALHSRLVSIIGNAESVVALDVPRRSLGGAVADLGKLDYDNLPEAASRDFSLSLAHTYIAGLLLEQAMASGAAEDKVAATEWCSRDLVPVVARWERGDYAQDKQSKDWDLVFSGYNAEQTFP